MRELKSEWELRMLAGEPTAVVRVENLQTVTDAPADSWGMHRGSGPQPLLITAEVSFKQLFADEHTQDRLTEGTVHYGSLSREILAAMKNHIAVGPAPSSLGHLVQNIFVYLTAQDISASYLDDKQTQCCLLPKKLISSSIRLLSITATLPKGLLNGSGVSFTATVFPEGNCYSTRLQLHKIQVPTLIGLNDHERTAKQSISVTVAFDKARELIYMEDIHRKVEALTIDVLEKSSKGTLESLGMHLADELLHDFDSYDQRYPQDPFIWQAQVKIEKPVAVPLAENPVVEVRASLADFNKK